MSAALVIQTFVRLRAVDPGFDAAGRMTLSYFAPRARYPDAGRLVALVDRVREEIGRVPGVRAAGVAQALPFAPGVVWLQALTRDDPRGVANLGALPHVHYNVVSAGYAEALGVPTKAGRTFDATDTAGSLPVVVINDALARRFFPGQDPIGQSLWVGHAQALPTLPRRTVVGVVGDARWSGLDEPAGPEAWVPYAQQAGTEDILRTMFLVFHAAGDAEAAMPAVRAQAARADPDLPLTSVRSLGSRIDEAVWRQRLAAAALGALGIAALAVALMGVLAVTSYLVGRRAHEMGVRLALGARPRAIVRLVLVESGWLVLLGTGLGVLGALAMGRLLSTMLYGVGTTDAPTFVAAGTALAATAIAACYLPARRASRVDPLITLRSGSAGADPTPESSGEAGAWRLDQQLPGIEQPEAFTLDVLLRLRAGLRDDDGDGAAGSRRVHEAGAQQRRLHAAAAEARQRPGAAELRDVTVQAQRPAAGDLAVDAGDVAAKALRAHRDVEPAADLGGRRDRVAADAADVGRGERLDHHVAERAARRPASTTSMATPSGSAAIAAPSGCPSTCSKPEGR